MNVIIFVCIGIIGLSGMLWIILGDYGSGKTLYMVLEAVSSKKDVLGNFTIKGLKNYQKIDIMDLKDIGFGKLILLDEMQTWLESRTSMSFRNRYITNIVDESRKRGIDVFGTAHLFTSIDIRFRSNCHRIIKCSRVGQKDNSWGRDVDYRDFKYETLNTYNFKVRKKRLPYQKAEPYFKLYDTLELIKYPNQQDIEFEVRKDDPKELYKYLNTVAKKIQKDVFKNNGKMFTHSDVQMGLIKNGFSLKHERLIYSKLKEILDKKKLQN